MTPQTAKRIEAMLRTGVSFHAFRSGGGLRVINATTGKGNAYYGESYCMADALRITADDFDAGGRKYGEVYGEIESHYLTGSSESSDLLDKWIVQGNSFDASYATDLFHVILNGWAQDSTPSDIMDRVSAGEDVVQHTKRGVVYETQRYIFPSGELGFSTRVISNPNNKQTGIWQITRTGSGATLLEAFENALAAPDVEK